MATQRFILVLLIICGLSATFAGCFGSSPSPRFYTLVPPESERVSETTGLDTAVGIGPVTIPDYLDRKQIVTRSGRNEIFLAEFDQWGGSLEEEISRALVTDLAVRLSSKGITVLPWRSPLLAKSRTVYRIPVTVTRFDGTRWEKVVLNAQWGVFIREKREEGLLAKESTLTEEVPDKSYEALVAAMGKAVKGLGKEIAECVVTVAAKKTDNKEPGVQGRLSRVNMP